MGHMMKWANLKCEFLKDQIGVPTWIVSENWRGKKDGNFGVSGTIDLLLLDVTPSSIHQ